MTNERKKFADKLELVWKVLRLTDRRRLFARRKAFLRSLEDASFDAAKAFMALYADFEKAAKRSLVPHAKKLVCEFPPDLPITKKIDEIRRAIKSSQVVIICGATGSGKTTQLPKAALLEGFGRHGRIGCTQPRRIAASSLAARFAAETKVECGNEVGYKLRFNDRTSASTVVKFMTEGILLAETREDPLLLQYDCIILDEVHERSLNVDFLLGYFRLLLSKRKDMHLVISSATLDASRFSEFFDDAPVIEVEGRLFPVEDVFLPPDEDEADEEVEKAVARGIEYLTDSAPKGDVLVFLPGEREIRLAANYLADTVCKSRGDEILPLYGRLSGSAQERIFHPKGSARRIILSTNVAETSLTIPGIRYVVDTGLVRLSRYNPGSRIQELRLETISRAAAMQRRGRCGRLRDGICVHLYPEERLSGSAEFTPPEIQRSSLAGVILRMADLNLPPVEEFPFIDPPSSQLMREGTRALRDIGALDKERRITPLGRRLAELPVDPHLAKIIVEGVRRGVGAEMLVIAAYLSIQDPRERPFEKQEEADNAHRAFACMESDFLSIIKLWQAVEEVFKNSNSAARKFAIKNFLNFKRLREWRNLCDDVAEYFEYEIIPSDAGAREVKEVEIHKSLMSGLPRQLAVYDRESNSYRDMAGRKMVIFPGSTLAKAKKPFPCILAFAFAETSRLFARTCGAVDAAWLEDAAPCVCTKSYDRIAWDEKSGFVYAREKVMAGLITVHSGRRCHYGRIDRAKAREVFIKEGLATGRAYSPICQWLKDFSNSFKLYKSLEERMRMPDNVLDANAIEKHFLKVLPETIDSVDALVKDWKKNKVSYIPDEETMLLVPSSELDLKAFPDFVTSCGQRIKVRYKFDPGEEGDGLTFRMEEDKLNLVDRHFPEYLVPGYLLWKVDFILRCLPKVARKEIMPLGDTAKDFVEAVRNGEIYVEQSLADALGDFLKNNFALDVAAEDFSFDALPAYLVPSILVEDERGKVIQSLHEIPFSDGLPDRVSPHHKAAKKWITKGRNFWPFDEFLPEKIVLDEASQRLVYPALTDEGASVGSEVFLTEDEAKASHVCGVLRLFKIGNASFVKHVKNGVKLPKEVLLTAFMDYPDWQDDLLDGALEECSSVPLHSVRTKKDFEEFSDAALQNLAEKADDFLNLLETAVKAFTRAESLLRNFDEDSFTFLDVLAQVETLFRPGFLRSAKLVKNFPRYFKAMATRLERAQFSTAKDEAKGEEVDNVLRKIRLAVEECESKRLPQRLESLLLLAGEARICAYTPEIRTVCKASSSVLAQAWDDFLKGRKG